MDVAGAFLLILWLSCCVVQMLHLVRNVKLPRDDSWLLDIGKFVFFHAYFDAKDASNGLVEVCWVGIGLVNEWVGGRLHKWMDGWVDGLMLYAWEDRWMNG